MVDDKGDAYLQAGDGVAAQSAREKVQNVFPVMRFAKGTTGDSLPVT